MGWQELIEGVRERKEKPFEARRSPGPGPRVTSTHFPSDVKTTTPSVTSLEGEAGGAQPEGQHSFNHGV